MPCAMPPAPTPEDTALRLPAPACTCLRKRTVTMKPVWMLTLAVLSFFKSTPTTAEGQAQTRGPTVVHDAASPWVGGYVVSDGTSVTAGVDAQGRVVSNISSFSVEQECICSCSPFGTDGEATCLGANDGNAFSALAWRREDGTWWMEQSSLGTTPLYKVPFSE